MFCDNHKIKIRGLRDRHRDELDGDDGIVILGTGRVDGHDNVLSLNDFSENRVLRLCGFIKPVQERVVDRVDEELAAAAVGCTSVGHAESEGLVRDLGAVGLTEFVRDAALAVSGDRLAAHYVSGAGLGSPSTSLARLGIPAVRTAKLNHKVGNGSVDVKTVIEPFIYEVNEVGGRQRHRLRVNLGLVWR